MKNIIRTVINKLGYEIMRSGSAEEAHTTDFSDADRALCAKVGPFTMTSRERVAALRAAVLYLSENQIAGDFMECGVWRGGSMMAAALTLIAKGDTSRELHLFDTFEGMPPPQDVDKRFDGTSAQSLLDTHAKTKDDPYWALAPLDDVRQNVFSTGYPVERIHFVKGMIEQTIPADAPERIALLRLDTDWYESTRHELLHLYERVVPRGVIIIDDYGWYSGARKAVDEFLAGLAFRPLLNRIDRTGRLIIKP